MPSFGVWGRVEQAARFRLGSAVEILRGFFGRQIAHGGRGTRFLDDSHFLPVVGEFFSAIETDHIGTGEGGGRSAAFRGLGGHGKTEILVPAPKEGVNQPGKHTYLPRTRALGGPLPALIGARA